MPSASSLGGATVTWVSAVSGMVGPSALQSGDPPPRSFLNSRLVSSCYSTCFSSVGAVLKDCKIDLIKISPRKNQTGLVWMRMKMHMSGRIIGMMTM
ncbi:26S proteasome complex subunit SEM1 isoform X2 [Panthera tigris]|uniref:26S proteasome complex subunit SEM1 isoform X2 n=1 Tax=Panthera leo TaxID=9689 RepID=UPI001C6A87CF|nr:26S proteasome complex subunit SEM1 isoform X2 [Panthera leo]XP_042822735.1 26S proteasome complex subunit SEM1 isoform X2 [Panthera tigris]